MTNPPTDALKIVLVDDEELARIRLRGLVHDCTDPQATVVFEAANTAQALAWLVAHDCDAVLLDVQMPGRDGTQLAADLRQLVRPEQIAVSPGAAATGESVPVAPAPPAPAPSSPAIVFVTAHAQHALKAFDLEATDYLTKPVKRERLQAALQRVAHRRALHRGVLPATLTGAWAAADEQPVIIVSDRGRVVRVPLGEVLYLKAELKYVTLRTARHTHVIDEPLSDLEARLGNRFLRVHRNALVSRRAVRALERRTIAGEGGDEDGGASGEVWAVRIAPVDEWLAVSRRQVSAVREALLAAGR